MPTRRKGVVQIRFEMLEYLYYNTRPQPRTHVWRKATTLSYDDFVKHLEALFDKGLVSEEEGDLIITKEGRGIYDRLKQVLFTIL
jgi:predicted transcriptional regulator